ncbi:tetratricopeptide repeat protein [Tunturiibacter lichenicola]|jgi:Flp pilus assembly protein TadD|uniref:tetratricopeptide repeat protein n=1 Tax=Tunturiibacter lichenicola TaxID=2051959 RepID=UPI003D9B0123
MRSEIKRNRRYVADRRERLVTASLALVASIFWATSVLAQRNSYADYMREGTEALTRGSLSTAKADLEAAVHLEPRNPAGWYEMGELYGQLGDFRKAEEAFRHTLQLQPDLAKAHYMLGLSLVANPKSKLDWPAAITEFRAALKIQPDYPEASTYLGVGLTATGQTDLAISELEQAVRIAPSLPSAHFNLAIALENSNRLEDAVKQYREAIAAKGSYAEASSALGKLLLRLGRGEEAEKELRNSLRLNPDLQDAHYGLARVLQSLKRPTEAKIEFDEAVLLGRREPDAVESSQLSNLALQMASKGDMAGAESSLRKAILLRPDYGVPHYNLGLILADRGDRNGAVQQLTEAISLLPGQAKPWFDLGRVQRLQGKPESALESLSWADRLAPSDPRIQAELQLTRSEMKMPPATDAAMPALQPKAGAFADTAAEHLVFAKQLSANGDLLGAIGELLRSLALSPAAVDVRSRLAHSYEQLGDLDRARLEYRKILLVVPDDVDPYLAMGKISLALGRTDEASEEFRTVLRLQPDSVDAKRALLEMDRESQKSRE